MNWLDKLIFSHKLHGVIQFVISSLLVYGPAERLYGQHSGHIMYLIMFPDWMLLLWMFLGLIGYLFSWKVFSGRMKLWKGYLFIFLVLIIDVFFPVIF